MLQSLCTSFVHNPCGLEGMLDEHKNNVDKLEQIISYDFADLEKES